MSRTYRDINKKKWDRMYKALEAECVNKGHSRHPFYHQCGCHAYLMMPAEWDFDYSKNPSWFNHLTFHKRQRRLEKLLEVAVLKATDPDSFLWPLSRKPFTYYW